MCCFIRISMNNLKDIHNVLGLVFVLGLVVLSGFQWTIWRIYTTIHFTGNKFLCCFIRISMNNLKDIHNVRYTPCIPIIVVLSGFQWTIWRIYTTQTILIISYTKLFYQDFNEQFAAKLQKILEICKFTKKIFCYFPKKYYLCSNKIEGYTQ